MLIESTASTTKSIKELLEKIENNTIKQDGPFQMEDYLTGNLLIITLGWHNCITKLFELF